MLSRIKFSWSSFQPHIVAGMNLKFHGRNFSQPCSDPQNPREFSTSKILGYTVYAMFSSFLHTEFGEFLKMCESRLEKKLNEMCLFRYVSVTLKESIATIGERIGSLKTDTDQLCKRPTTRVTVPPSCE